MATVEWTHIAEVDVPARPVALWTVAVEYVERVTRLRLTAGGTWSYSANHKDGCGPDGDVDSNADSTKRILPSAPPGALIGKLGGSSAGLTDGHVFVVGSYCVLEPGKKWKEDTVPDSGALYLTINDTSTGMGDNGGTLHVKIQDGTVPGETRATSSS